MSSKRMASPKRCQLPIPDRGWLVHSSTLSLPWISCGIFVSLFSLVDGESVAGRRLSVYGVAAPCADALSGNLWAHTGPSGEIGAAQW